VDATVPAHRVQSLASNGSDISDAAIYRLPFLTVFPHAATVPVVGAAQGALEDYVASQKDRVTLFGSKVASEPSTQIRVAESAADLDAARLSLFRNFADITAAAVAGGEYSTELLARIDRDQVLATRRAVAAVDRVFASAGAGALSLDNPIQRTWRDVHAGAAHFASIPEGKLGAYGALAFGLPPTGAH
jgi:3-hydroxy-9,10-secoandrosta-1,3,5(10)-triene-9,17-dione monooxygenase